MSLLTLKPMVGIFGLGGPELIILLALCVALVAVPTILVLVLLLRKGKNSGARDSGPLPESRQKKCPDCAEYVKAEARICKHCGHAFSEGEAKPA